MRLFGKSRGAGFAGAAALVGTREGGVPWESAIEFARDRFELTSAFVPSMATAPVPAT
jgi:hypothetical protein